MTATAEHPKHRGVRVLCAFVVLALLAMPAAARADRIYGAWIPDETRKVGDGRYRATRDWDHTLRKLAGAYYNKDGYVWRRMATSPNVQGIHIQNVNRNQQWEGINVYETGGKIIIYVLPNPDYVVQKKKRSKRKKK